MMSASSLWVHVLLAVTAPDASRCLTPPVSTAIAVRFVAPSCPYCAGHRTLDFSTTPGTDVVAPIDGSVTFAGVVAGSLYITMSVSSGSRTGSESDPARSGFDDSDLSGSMDAQGSTYLVTIGGVIADRDVVANASVGTGRKIGTASGDRIRLSLRRTVPGGEAVYLDPEESLVRWRSPVRLVPAPGTVPGRVVTRAWTCRRPL